MNHPRKSWGCPSQASTLEGSPGVAELHTCAAGHAGLGAGLPSRVAEGPMCAGATFPPLPGLHCRQKVLSLTQRGEDNTLEKY